MLWVLLWDSGGIPSSSMFGASAVTLWFWWDFAIVTRHESLLLMVALSYFGPGLDLKVRILPAAQRSFQAIHHPHRSSTVHSSVPRASLLVLIALIVNHGLLRLSRAAPILA